MEYALRQKMDKDIEANPEQEKLIRAEYRCKELEMVLREVIRTGWPWDEKGGLQNLNVTTEFCLAMVESKNALGLPVE